MAKKKSIGKLEVSHFTLFQPEQVDFFTSIERDLGSGLQDARHSIHYRKLTHYFFEFDIYDKLQGAFLDLKHRLSMLERTGIQTVPVLQSGALSRSELEKLIIPSQFDSVFDNPFTKQQDKLMEGLSLRTESNGIVSGRAKFVRPEFVEKIKQSTHWQQQQLVPNELAEGVDIWS